jgi:hypothetical protein
MIRGFLDVPYKSLKKAQDAITVTNRHKVCEIVPQARFSIQEDGSVSFDGLVCKDLGGRSTGVGAGYCTNCKLEKEDGR